MYKEGEVFKNGKFKNFINCVVYFLVKGKIIHALPRYQNLKYSQYSSGTLFGHLDFASVSTA